MACGGNGMSDARIGVALIKEVIEEELKDIPSEDVPPLTPLAEEVQTEQEQMVVNQVASLVRKIGDKLKDDAELQDAIDGMTRCSGSMSEKFKKVAESVLGPGITWERIAVLFYVAGQLAVKMVQAHLPQSVREILRWTVDYFRNHLLDWVQKHGGWINSFSALAAASVNSVSSMSSHSYGLLMLVTGVALGSIVTWRLTRQP